MYAVKTAGSCGGIAPKTCCAITMHRAFINRGCVLVAAAAVVPIAVA
jgi:hypothetical protein